MSKNIETAQRIQERYEFYVLALTFTLLGLSIQTADFGKLVAADIIELLGWISLLVSGVAGLSRLEWSPTVYRLFSELDRIDHKLDRLSEQKMKGVTEVDYEVESEMGQYMPQPIDSVIQIERKLRHDKFCQVQQLQRQGKWKYLSQKWALVCGFLFLIVSRALPPMLGHIYPRIANVFG